MLLISVKDMVKGLCIFLLLVYMAMVEVLMIMKKLNLQKDVCILVKTLIISILLSICNFLVEGLIIKPIIYDGLDAQILRLGNITNRYSDGMFQRNPNDNAFAKRLKSFIEIGAFPNYLLEHTLEFTPVDLASKAIIQILNYSSDCNMFHIVDPLYLPIKDLVETINSVGINMLPVSDTLMNDIINGMLTNDDRKQAVSGIIQDLNKERRLIYTSLVKPSFAFTVNYLKSCRFSLEKN